MIKEADGELAVTMVIRYEAAIRRAEAAELQVANLENELFRLKRQMRNWADQAAVDCL